MIVRTIKILFVILVALNTLPTIAVEFDLSVLAGVEHTSNSVRNSAEEQDDWIFTPGFQLEAVEDKSQFYTVSADYQFKRRIYESGVYEANNIIVGQGAFDWHISPEYLSVGVNYDQRETAIRSGIPDQPNNRQETRQAGGYVELRASPIRNHEISIRADRSSRDVNRTDIDSDQDTLTFNYIVPLKTGNIGLEFSASETDFSSAGFPDLETRKLHLVGERNTRHTEFFYRLGATEIDRNLGRGSLDGPSGDVTWIYNFAGRSAIALSASRTLGDTFGQVFSRNLSGVQETVNANTDTGDVQTNTNYALRYTSEIGVNEVQLSVGHTEIDYEDLLQDQRQRIYSLGVRRPVNPQVTAFFNATFLESEFLDTDQKTDIYTIQIGGAWQGSRRLSVSVALEYERQNSNFIVVPADGPLIPDEAAAGFGDFDVLNVRLDLVWVLL